MAQLQSLWIVRHGESAGNVLAYEAEAAGAELIDVPDRDPDVPLSPDRPGPGRGDRALVRRPARGRTPGGRRGLALPAHPADRRADPGRRSGCPPGTTSGCATGSWACSTGSPVTAYGPGCRHEAQRRDRLGKFYYRPPGGESWADVALRLRSLLGDLRRDHAGRRVLLVGHEALIFLLRYLLEELDEAALIALTRREVVGNCSVSGWRCGPDGRFTGTLFNHVDHLREQGTAATSEEEIDAEPV